MFGRRAHLVRWLAAGWLVVLAGSPAPLRAGDPSESPQWGAFATPAAMPPQSYGGHARGCLAGGVPLPLSGVGYEVMRPSRHRYYGNPELIAFIEAFAREVQAQEGQAPGGQVLLIGDLAQPRGGPMRTGHRSHQSGLDVDIWFMEASSQPLSDAERESLAARSMLTADGSAVDPAQWSAAKAELLRLAAGFAEVDRIFVNPVIKQELCTTTTGDREWLRKIRPWWGHDEHFHVGLRCPDGAADCRDREPPVPPGDGCDASLAWWFSDEAKQQVVAPKKPAAELTLADLPAACRDVVAAP